MYNNRPTPYFYLSHLLHLALQITLVLFIFSTATAQTQESNLDHDPLQILPLNKLESVRPGELRRIEVPFSISAEYHAYVDKFQIKVLEPDNVTISELKVVPTEEFFDKFSKTKRMGVKGQGSIHFNMSFPAEFKKDSKTLKAKLTYQACSDTICLFPTDKIIEWPLELQWTDQSKINMLPGTDMFFDTKSLENILGTNLFLAFLFVFIAGILTSFSPCIFPMIPITLAILNQDAERRSRTQNFLVSLSYVHGIATTYSLLGLVAASTGSVFGASLGKPWVIFIMCCLFLAMSLSLYGLFDLQVPHHIRKLHGANHKKQGYLGAYISGLIAGVVASPCVGPVLVGILTFVASTQNKILGFMILFTYAMGMGLIFLFLGVFTEVTRKLPRSGPWLEATKFIMGSLMLGVFYYYLKFLIPLRWHDFSLGVGLVIIASYYGAFSKPNRSIHQLRKGLMMAILALGIGYLLLGSFDLRPLLKVGDKINSEKKVPQWVNFKTVNELEEVLQNGKPTMVDFFAEWCAACHELDKKTFSQDEFLKLSSEFNILRFDATEESVDLEKFKLQYNIQGLPTVLFFNREGKWIKEITLTQFEEIKPFYTRMKKATE